MCTDALRPGSVLDQALLGQHVVHLVAEGLESTALGVAQSGRVRPPRQHARGLRVMSAQPSMGDGFPGRERRWVSVDAASASKLLGCEVRCVHRRVAFVLRGRETVPECSSDACRQRIVRRHGGLLPL